ncbi:hypothetical protein Y032_0068g146 [Ancylostoma ceylanicum]|uniref:Uncharacterized protein n=1 Tax=Ancylostoma ceylanicum TaxID=53326 RepID=A0A016TYB3_9BILA|nr:hypothetical protein Y032_0068g146 [Ancylostoma ceylanicum]
MEDTVTRPRHSGSTEILPRGIADATPSPERAMDVKKAQAETVKEDQILAHSRFTIVTSIDEGTEVGTALLPGKP